ncbi:hypothetical protein FB446DRAFT_25603 [Lentinula raphanica]|nr:hypothetical protein FB446DRAFT_25603 [Lentinula raphanica]
MTPRFVCVLKLGIVFAFLVSTVLSPGVFAAPIPFTEMELKTRNGPDGSGSSAPPMLRARDTNFSIDVSPSKSPTEPQSNKQPKTAVGDHKQGLTDEQLLSSDLLTLTPQERGLAIKLKCNDENRPKGETREQCIQGAVAFIPRDASSQGPKIIWPPGYQV